MINTFLVILTALSFLSSGWYLTYLFPLESRIERLGLAFLIGAGMTTFLWFIGNLLGLPFNLYTLLLIEAGEILIGYYATSKNRMSLKKAHPFKPARSELIVTLIIIAILLIAFLIGSHNPLMAWDSIALYDFRAHTIAINHSLKDLTDSSYYVSYPLMISLMHSIVYMLGGVSAQGLHAITLMALTSVIYGRMREWTNHSLALTACLLVVTQHQIFYHATFAYTNLPYTAYLVSGLIYAISARAGKLGFLPLAGLVLGFSTWMRASETFWVVGILLLLAQGLILKKKLLSVLAVAILLLIRFTWSIYLNAVLVSIHYTYEQTFRAFGFHSILEIIANRQALYTYIKNNVFVPYQGIWFLSVPVTLIAIVKKDHKLILLTSAILLSAVMVVVGIMVFSTYYTTWSEIGDSARRMVMFVEPLTIIASVYALSLRSRRENHDK